MRTNKPYVGIIMLGDCKSGKSTVLTAMAQQVLLRGYELETGCDPCMTREGRLLVKCIEEIKRSVGK